MAGKMKFRSAYSPPVKVEFISTEPSLTRQAFREECQINSILDRYQKTGIVEHVNTHSPQYGDISALDFKEAQDTLAKARTMFEELPSAAREHFHHDPQEFLEYVNEVDDVKLNLLADLGLTKPGRRPKSAPPMPESEEPTTKAEDQPINPT